MLCLLLVCLWGSLPSHRCHIQYCLVLLPQTNLQLLNYWDLLIDPWHVLCTSQLSLSITLWRVFLRHRAGRDGTSLGIWSMHLISRPSSWPSLLHLFNLLFHLCLAEEHQHQVSFQNRLSTSGISWLLSLTWFQHLVQEWLQDISIGSPHLFHRTTANLWSFPRFHVFWLFIFGGHLHHWCLHPLSPKFHLFASSGSFFTRISHLFLLMDKPCS